MEEFTGINAEPDREAGIGRGGMPSNGGEKPGRGQAQAALPEGGSLWSLVKSLLAQATESDIFRGVIKVAEANSINIPEWGINKGSIDAHDLRVGTSLDVSSLFE